MDSNVQDKKIRFQQYILDLVGNEVTLAHRQSPVYHNMNVHEQSKTTSSDSTFIDLHDSFNRQWDIPYPIDGLLRRRCIQHLT
jgi:hypothetical protein